MKSRLQNIFTLLGTLLIPVLTIWQGSATLPAKLALTACTIMALCFTPKEYTDAEQIVLGAVGILGPIATILLMKVPAGSSVAAIITTVLAVFTDLPTAFGQVTPPASTTNGQVGKVAVSVLAVLSTLGLLSMPGCAWWQKHGSQIDCAALSTVEDAPQLVTIVEGCMAIAVDPAAIPACVEAAAASKWTNDVIQCFTSAAQSKAKCPAYEAGKASNKPLKSTYGVSFKVISTGYVAPMGPPFVQLYNQNPTAVRAVFPSLAVAEADVTWQPLAKTQSFAAGWAYYNLPDGSATAGIYVPSQPQIFPLGNPCAAMMGGLSFMAALPDCNTCQTWKAAKGLAGAAIQCLGGFFILQ
jgi:hypothetical protein